MSTWLQAFRGQHITILTNVGENERTDTGTLLEIGDGWLQISKDNGEMILVPSSAIRMVKLLNMAHSLPALEREPDARVSNHIYEPNAQTLP